MSIFSWMSQKIYLQSFQHIEVMGEIPGAVMIRRELSSDDYKNVQNSQVLSGQGLHGPLQLFFFGHLVTVCYCPLTTHWLPINQFLRFSLGPMLSATHHLWLLCPWHVASPSWDVLGSVKYTLKFKSLVFLKKQNTSLIIFVYGILIKMIF